MCGLTGVIHFDQKRIIDPLGLKKTTDIISYRGPDGDGFYMDGNIGLGHRRLSIIDLSNGIQLMYSLDKEIVILFNGKIYKKCNFNLIQLHDQLKNTTLNSDCFK